MAEIHRPDVYPPDERITQPSHQLLSDYDETCHDPNIHLASVAEKKRLWWRNAVVNASFIASWCVPWPSPVVVGCFVSDLDQNLLLLPNYTDQISVPRFFFATILSIYNKWMFSPEHFGFPSPLFVTTLHMFVQFLLAALIRAIWPGRFRPQRTPTRADYAWVLFLPLISPGYIRLRKQGVGRSHESSLGLYEVTLWPGRLRQRRNDFLSETSAEIPKLSSF